MRESTKVKRIKKAVNKASRSQCTRSSPPMLGSNKKRTSVYARRLNVTIFSSGSLLSSGLYKYDTWKKKDIVALPRFFFCNIFSRSF